MKVSHKGVVRTLKSYIAKNGKAKTAVALGIKDTNALGNWVARETIPEHRHEAVKDLKRVQIVKKYLTPDFGSDND